MTDALTLTNVTKTYRNKTHSTREVIALRNINLTVAEKTFLSLMGPSGSGKTTLLKVAAGYLAPDTGTVQAFGQDIYSLPISERLALRNRTFGFLFQGDQLLDDLSAAENVELPLIIRGMPTKQRQENVIHALESVGVSALRDSRPGEVSGGEKRRISLARSIINGCRILFADEPTSNLDTATASTVLEALHHLNGSGMTIVAATHDPLVASKAHSVIMIRDGAIDQEKGNQ
jgi:putative ABC transport system ATP-binding protein